MSTPTNAGAGPELSPSTGESSSSSTPSCDVSSSDRSASPPPQTPPSIWFQDYEPSDVLTSFWDNRTQISLGTVPQLSDLNPHITRASFIIHSDYPHEDVADGLMKQLVIALKPVMDSLSVTVDNITEYYPSNRDRGANRQQGIVVFVRLRKSDDRTTFRSFNDVLDTALHELAHNFFFGHDGDFYSLYDDLVKYWGVAGSDSTHYRLQNPMKNWPAGYVAIITGGIKTFVLKTDFSRHFSKLAIRAPESPFVLCERKYEPSVVIRLCQIANGLEHSDDGPLDGIINNRHYWDNEYNRFGVIDKYHDVSVHNEVSLRLTLKMFVTGDDFGMHDSTRQWLIWRLSRILHWNPLFSSKTWQQPELLSTQATAEYLAASAQIVYEETTQQHQCLRNVVLAMLRGLFYTVRTPQFYDWGVLMYRVSQVPDLWRDMHAPVALVAAGQVPI